MGTVTEQVVGAKGSVQEQILEGKYSLCWMTTHLQTSGYTNLVTQIGILDTSKN